MSYPILYEANATDFFNNGLGTLPDAISSLVTEERNGEFVLDMTYPLHGIRANQLKNNRIIKVDAGHKLTDQRFVIKTVTPAMDNSGNTIITVHAEHISYLSNDLAIQPQLSMTDMTAEQALNFWNRNLTTPNQFTVDSDITTHNGTTWSIDKVQTARQALGGVEGSILDVWGGEYRFDNLHISLLSKRGTVSNTLLAYGRNITSFEQEQNIMDTYTSVYPYFIQKGDKDEQDTIYTIDNYVVDSANANKFPNKKPLPLDLSSELGEIKVGTKPSDAGADDKTEYISVATLKSRMKTYAQQYIKNNNIGVPKISIKISFVDLSKTANYADVAPLEQLDLCDNVPIKFPDLDIDTTAKVSRVVWNVLTDSYDSLELGDISATLGDKIAEIDQKANKAKETADNIVQVGADGKSTVFRGQDTPTANHIGDLWYKPNGEDTEMYQWDGVSWHFVMSTKDTHDISDKVDQAMQEMADKEKEINGKLESNQIDISQAQKDLEQVKQDTANQLADIRDSVVKDVADAKAQSKDALDKANGVDDKASQALENATEAKETATTVATDMDTVKGEISSKADKSTVDTINQTVSDQGTKITQNANDIKSKASSSDVDKLSGRVSTAETTLLQTAQGLTGKADSSQLNKLSGDLTTLSNNFSTTSSGFNASLSKIDDKVNANKEETDSALSVAKADIKATADNLSTNYTKTIDEHNYVNSQIKESADKINLSVTSVSDKVDGMEIGGRNYIENSKPDSQSGWFFSSGGTNDYKVVDGQYIELTRTGGSYHQINRQYQNDKDGWFSEIRPGDHFAISMDVSMTKVPAVDSILYGQLRLNAGDTFNSTKKNWNLKDIIKKANTWYRVSSVTDIPDNWETDFTKATMARFLIESQSGSDTDVIRIRNIQLEKGNKATNYKPSDADTDSKIAALQIDADGIKQTVSNKADTSYVDQKANQITSTVGKQIDDIQIGGNNLLLDTDHYVLYNGNGGSNQIAASYEFNDGVISNWAIKGQEYTLSFDWMTSGTPKGTFNAQFHDVPWGTFNTQKIDLAKEKTGHISITQLAIDSWVNSDAKAHGIQFRTDGFTGGLIIYNVKLEKGNKSTGWTPAPTEPSPNLLLDADIADMNKYRSYGKYFSDAGASQVNIDFKDGITTPTSNNLAVVEATNTKANNNQTGGRNLAWNNIVMSDGDTYTMSCYARKISGNASIRFQYGGAAFYNTYQTIDSTVWKKYSWTFVFNADAKNANGNCQVYLGGISTESVGTIQTTGFRLERTNSAISDMGDSISRIEQTADKINATVAGKADKDNLVSQINIDKSGVLIQGKKIMIDGDTYIKNGVIKSAMIDTLNASKITAGTLNAANVNIINMNANNITTGTLRGTNLSMNLNTGEVLFQKGSIKSTNGKLNISVNDGTMSVTNSSNEGIYFKDGKMMLSNSNPFNNQKIAYGLVSYETPWVLNGGLTITGYQGALLTATDKNITASSYNNNHPWFRDTVGNIDFYGGFNNGSGVAVRENDVVIGSAKGRVDLSGGSQFTSGGLYEQPHIEVGSPAWNSGGVFNDNKGIGQNIVMNANGIELAAAGGIAAHAPIFDVYGNFSVHGKKNAVVSTSKGDVAIDAYETAEYYFGDIGALNTGKSGCAKVIIDSLFNETVNTSIPYHVFITAYEDSYIWVTDRTTTSFIVHSSKPNIDVSYEIKAKRLGYEGDRLEIQKEYI